MVSRKEGERETNAQGDWWDQDRGERRWEVQMEGCRAAEMRSAESGGHIARATGLDSQEGTRVPGRKVVTRDVSLSVSHRG